MYSFTIFELGVCLRFGGVTDVTVYVNGLISIQRCLLTPYFDHWLIEFQINKITCVIPIVYNTI